MNESELQLKELIDKYIPIKKNLDAVKKEVDSKGKEIKQMMIDLGKDKLPCDGGTISCTKREKQEMDMSKALDILKQNGIKAIKTVEMVDEDELEKLIYNRQIPMDVMKELQKCTKTTVSYALVTRFK